MFQLMYLRFTSPRADPTSFAAAQSQARALLANRMASPEVVFNDTIEAVMSRDNRRRRSETPATVGEWNLDKSLAFYKARFADASNFTFVFVGSFTQEAIKPLVERYIASLPATHSKEAPRDLGIVPPDGVVEKTVEKGIAPKSEVAIIFSGPFENNDANRLTLQAMTAVLEGRLFDTIRQELGGTYSITVEPDIERFPKPHYTVRIDWTCDPAQAVALTRRVFDEIAFVKSTALTESQVARLRAGMTRDFEQNSQSNSYFLNEISRRYANGEKDTVGAITRLPERLARLSGEAIQQMARSHLDTARFVKVVLMPETK